LEFLYTGEYYPQKIPGQRGLVKDPTLPELDQNGDQLLKHARVYTLADKLGMGLLRTLAHSKIHCVNSSAKGEIAYARYVYATTAKDDDTIRKPVASFWAHRSHVLRQEAEEEFRDMCLEYPQFGFDVLSEFPAFENNCTLHILIFCHSSCIGRKTQKREWRQTLCSRQLSEKATAEPGLIILFALITVTFVCPFLHRCCVEVESRFSCDSGRFALKIAHV
jgi:hypothetical protein